MKVLVTGGTGFVGTNLIKRLLKDGHEVISVDNYSTGVKENEQKGCQYYNFDISERDVPYGRMYWPKSTKVIDEVGYPDVIFHMAALARIQPSLEHPASHIKNNFNSTLHILELARKKNIPVVYAGSSSVHCGLYGSPYAWSKYGGEELCRLYSSVYDTPTAICRFYNVYGPHQILGSEYAAVIGIWIDQYKKGEPLTITDEGEQRRDFTHIDDIVDGLVKCGDGLLGENSSEIRGEVFELGRGVNHSMNEIVDMFGEHPRKYIPARKGEYPVTLCEDTKAHELLGWKPIVDIKDYIKEWLSENN
jgi:UDP-glucose 4-epimerase